GPGIELLVVEPGVQRDDLDPVVDAVHGDLGRARLGPADPLDAVGDLALQVGRVDVVAVRDDDAADARGGQVERGRRAQPAGAHDQDGGIEQALLRLEDRKSTRLNSSHVKISYAVFCLKKKI